MKKLAQSPVDPEFVQNPYPFYERARTHGPLFYWTDYDLPCAVSYDAVDSLLRDRRFGREAPDCVRQTPPPHLEPFYALENHSMLEREPPVHTRLRKGVLRSFTARKVASLEPGLTALTHDLIDAFPDGPFDLLPAFAEVLPVTVIARLIGVPDDMSRQLLDWSHDLVAMYQARRDRSVEDKAVAAALAFGDYIRDLIAKRKAAPRDDLISGLATGGDADRLSEAEVVSTVILLLNAGHEATVHAIGNGVNAIFANRCDPDVLYADAGTTLATNAEILRYDPPLHMFTRYATEPVEVFGHRFRTGDQVGLLLAAANRDPAQFAQAATFDPARGAVANAAFGAGLHFCVGAPLARLEMNVAMPLLFARCPSLSQAAPPVYANRYHFRGLEKLMVSR